MAGLLIAVTAGVTLSADKAPILLSCDGGIETDETLVAALCDVLEDELAARMPGHVVWRVAPRGRRVDRTWEVMLTITRTEPYLWEGHLKWGVGTLGNGAVLEVGPPVEVAGLDAPLSESAYRQFVQGLLEVSDPVFR